MKRFLSTMKYALVASMIVLASCSDDESTFDFGDGPAYVFLNAAEKWEEGYITAYNEFPSSEKVKPVISRSKQVNTSFGFRSFENAIYTRSNAAGDAGLQKYTVGGDGRIKSEGFILDASQFLVVNATTGFYLDEKRGTMKIQTFDPSTMTRTGEIDLSELRDTELAEYQVVGKHTIAAKEGKLYVGISYGKIATAGFGDDQIQHLEFAVIDIATKEFEKVITYEDEAGTNSIGWGSSGNKMWTLGDDGALYFYNTGLTNGFVSSKVIRIKAGATEFDTEWELNAADYGDGNNTSIATGLVKGGKFYLELASEDLTANFANLQNNIFDYYVVDMESGVGTKITGMPKHHYAYANEQAITLIDGEVYFWVRNTDDEVDAYYKLNADGTSATKVFNMAHDGFVWGFVKLNR